MHFVAFRRAALLLAAWLVARAAPLHAQPFVDVTAAAGIVHSHGYTAALADPDGSFAENLHFAGGVAAADYDDDGDIDLYFVRGDTGPGLLYRNRGDGSFDEVAAAAGLDLQLVAGCGPAFADLDGDGHRDLFIGGVRGSGSRLLRNRGDGTFADVTAAAGLATARDTFSAAFADVDRDGDLDVALAHWATFLDADASSEDLWRNDGSLRFTDVSIAAGTAASVRPVDGLRIDFSFTPAFADLDADGWPDLLVAGDFGRSRVLRNDRSGAFRDASDPRILTDENGMGSAVGDFDGDGHLDWFVTSIHDPIGGRGGNWGVTGNRLYRGRGDGTFADATDAAGVREGFWGWAAVAADLDDDGHLDLVHVNGYGRFPDFPPALPFLADPTRVFRNRGDGTFTEAAAAMGLADTGMGRGLVVADLDRDGDLDVVIANNGAPPRLFRNERSGPLRHLGLRLRGRGANREAVGARVLLHAGGRTQLREVALGGGYASQNPAEAHFGLGTAARAERLDVFWPGGGHTVLHDVAPTPLLTLDEPDRDGRPACAGDCDEDRHVTVDEVVRAVAIALGLRLPGDCPAADTDASGAVTVDEIVAALAAALDGCPDA